MKLYTKTEKTLLEKLQKVEEGEEVSLTADEASLYRVEVIDILPDEDLETDYQSYEPQGDGTKEDV